jgi:hypothetical protein
VRFVSSALRQFQPDIEQHRAHGTCGRPVLGVLPLAGGPLGYAHSTPRTAA